MNKDKYMFIVLGFIGCGYYNAAVEALSLSKLPFQSHAMQRNAWYKKLAELQAIHPLARMHTTSPIVFKNGRYLGGHDKLVSYLQKR